MMVKNVRFRIIMYNFSTKTYDYTSKRKVLIRKRTIFTKTYDFKQAKTYDSGQKRTMFEYVDKKRPKRTILFRKRTIHFRKRTMYLPRRTMLTLIEQKRTMRIPIELTPTDPIP